MEGRIIKPASVLSEGEPKFALLTLTYCRVAGVLPEGLGDTVSGSVRRRELSMSP